MFGYVKPCKPELKIKDWERFKSYYCGLCHSIKELYGNIPRLSLNYDMTFLAMLLDALITEDTKYKTLTCPIHPLSKKALVCCNEALKYSAHMNVNLFYYKLLDDVNDDNSVKAKILCNILKSKVHGYTKDVGDVTLQIYFYLMELSKLENSKECLSIDELCDPFSTLTGYILSSCKNISLCDENKRDLYNLGYNLGKWIYLIDALDDLEEDMKKNKFNAFNFIYNKENLSYVEFRSSIINKAEFLLTSCGSQCLFYLNKLPLKKNKDLLYNIIHLGIMEKSENLTKGVIHND